MADIQSYSYLRKDPRHRTNSSHIPVPAGKRKDNKMSRPNASAPESSRLLLMQSRYQQQLLHEKEAKLIKMYQENQNAALGRLEASGPKRGIVRDFFRECRKIEQSETIGLSLNRTEHFQQKKYETKEELMEREEKKERELCSIRQENRATLLPQHRYGFSRSKPLAPVKKEHIPNMENASRPPGPDRQFEEISPCDHFKSRRTRINLKQPTGCQDEAVPEKSKKLKRGQRTTCHEESDDKHFKNKLMSLGEGNNTQRNQSQRKSDWETQRPSKESEEGDVELYKPRREKPIQPESTQLNRSKQKLQAKRKPQAACPDKELPTPAHTKRKSNHYSDFNETIGHNEDMSDYQKWQLEQNLKRAKRLEKYHNEKNHQPKDNHKFDYDEKERKVRHAQQHQRRKDLDDAEKQQRYMKELEEKIARKTLELAQLYGESENEDYPLQPQPTLTSDARSSQPNKPRNQHIRQDALPEKKELSKFSHSKTKSDVSSRTSNDGIITKPVGVGSRTKPRPKPSQHQQKSKELTHIPDNRSEIAKPPADNYYAEVAQLPEASAVNLNLRACPTCGRQFAVDRLAKHAKVCQKATRKKPRKVFDVQKQRLEGTEMMEYVKKGKHEKDERSKKKSNWRETHGELIRAIKDARKVQNHLAKGGDLRDLPPPAPTQHSDYKHCPHCQRRFNPTVAERHIPKCKEIKSRPPPPKKYGRR